MHVLMVQLLGLLEDMGWKDGWICDDYRGSCEAAHETGCGC